MDELKRIKKVTKDFREQKDLLWIGVGCVLVEKKIDINKIIIADCFTEDVAQYYFLVVTGDRHIFEFYYDYAHKEISEGKIVEWHDFTDNPQKAYMHESLGVAFENFDQI